MANVLTDLAADIYKSADEVGRELTGAVSSVLINSDGSERVAKGDTVRSHFTRQPSASAAITESMTIPEGTDQTVDNKTLTISKSQSVKIPWTGEDMKHVNNGSGFDTIYGDQIQQAMRTLADEIETDVCSAVYKGASRAIGVAGTAPFGSDFKLVAQARQILVDNGSPMAEITMVLNTLAGTNLRNLATLQKANEAGSDSLLRQGVLLDLQGVGFKESAGIASHTKGTGTSYTSSTAGFAIGTTDIALITGSGTVVAGDVVTFTGDTNKYVVEVGVAAPGTITIAKPGLLQALAASAVAMTIGNDFTGNFMLRRNAAELVLRAPAMPEGGDAAVDAMTVQDPFSGLVFDIRAYKGYHKSMFEVGAAWGQKAWKSEHIVSVLG